jgi:type IV pilus assembly protein PilA
MPLIEFQFPCVSLQELLMLKQIQKGFTLIELMIVVAIIGILAAIAIPAYQDYTIRSQVTEGLNLADAVKTGVAEFYANNGIWPTGLVGASPALGYTNDPAGKYVTDVTVLTGTIQITYGGQANANVLGMVLDLRPRLSANGDVIWICGKHSAVIAGITDPAAPATADATTVIDKYLPQNCRT